MRTRGGAIQRRTLALAALLLLVLNGAVIAAAVHFTRSADTSDKTIRRPNVVADLLGWLPQSDQTREVFAAQIGATNPTPPRGAPAPLTMGHTSAWRLRYGYGVENVSGWATAGTDASVAVLSGSFDWGGIEKSLRAAGFETSTYHRAVLFTAPAAALAGISDGDSMSAAAVVAVLDQRVITGATTEIVRAAIDAAQGRAPSLADLAPVAALVSSVSALTGLAAADQTNQAKTCAAISSVDDVGRGRYALAVFNASVNPPSGSVALFFEDDASAAAAMPALGGVGGVANLRQNNGLLLADVTGVAPMNLLFSKPKCESVRLALATVTHTDATPSAMLLEPSEVNQ